MVNDEKYIIVKENDSYFFNGKGYLLQNMNGDLPFWVMGRSLIHFNVVACYSMLKFDSMLVDRKKT